MKLYSKKVCPKCLLMKYELNQLGYEGKYEEILIDHNEEAKEKLLNAGFLSVPVIEIDGELMDNIENIKKFISRITL
ncbi:glutaredoxin family protein [Ureibacillus sp. FSL K6-0165]|uniref:glutaredoxin family protein n=1 Tax=Ureibacillus sp. FSL K6-0165 TaxID=2954606 RepID=UPI0030F845AB